MDTNMNATFTGIPRALLALVGALVALGLLLSVQGCSTTASADTSVTGPTPASALGVFNSFVTTQKVALANHDELLALSLLTGSQYGITAATYAATSDPVIGPVYGHPTLYVPKLITYPQWFMATVPERAAPGDPARTALLVFDRLNAETSWALSGSVLLSPGAPALKVAVGSSGYATALATSDGTLKLRPDVVGAMHAAITDDGPSSAASSAVQPGPLTTGLYQSNAVIARQAAAQNTTYSWELEGTSYPVFALRTTGGGAVVFYTMTLITLTVPDHLPPAHSTARSPGMPVPAALKNLVPATHPPFRHGLAVYSTLSYLALDPAGTAQTGKLQVIGTGGARTYVHGS
jgi:hypothetical protein